MYFLIPPPSLFFLLFTSYLCVIVWVWSIYCRLRSLKTWSLAGYKGRKLRGQHQGLEQSLIFHSRLSVLFSAKVQASSLMFQLPLAWAIHHHSLPTTMANCQSKETFSALSCLFQAFYHSDEEGSLAILSRMKWLRPHGKGNGFRGTCETKCADSLQGFFSLLLFHFFPSMPFSILWGGWKNGVWRKLSWNRQRL